MAGRTLEDVLAEAKSPVELLRNAQVGPNVYPGVPAEYTNWRDEMRAWQETCVLFNQSYHMAELMVSGPDALKLLSYLGTNSFENFAANKAKQFVPCTPEGHVIGDVILFANENGSYNLVGRAPALNWVTYHAETGDFNVTLEYDERTAMRSDGKRRHYRFQLQGPNAMQVLHKALGQAPADLKFFNMRGETIAGRQVVALRHGMAGQPGWELFGPWEEGEEIHHALVEAGKEFGMRLVGGRAYGANTLESGWIPSPLPAVYTGDSLKPYREWLTDSHYEAVCSLGGSYSSANIEDYYFTPWDLGYGHLVKFDHDFVGREALEKIAEQDHRVKVTLALDDGDVAERPRGGRRPRRRRVDVLRVQLQRALDALARGRRRRRRAGQRGDARLGRGGRRLREAGRRAARAGRDPRDRQPVPVRRGGAHDVRRGLADGVRLTLTEEGRGEHRCSTGGWWPTTTRSPGRKAQRDGTRSRPAAVDTASRCAAALRGGPLPRLARGGARARLRGLPRPPSLVRRRPRGLLGLALGLLRGEGGGTVRAGPGLGRDAGRRLVPGRGAELRRARSGPGRRRGHRRRSRPLADTRSLRADLR
jgi:syringate O-demethylase